MRKNLNQEFENRLLINLSKIAKEGESNLAKNLLRQYFPEVEKLFKKQRGSIPEGEMMIKRQKAVFLVFFSDIFSLKADSGEMDVRECKSALSCIFEKLFEDSKKHVGPEIDGTVPLSGAYEKIEIEGLRVSDNVSNASEDLVRCVDHITFGIERLDMMKTKKRGGEEVATPVDDFSVACWNYFLDLETL